MDGSKEAERLNINDLSSMSIPELRELGNKFEIIIPNYETDLNRWKKFV